jgi:hypothetical protein
VPAIGGAMWIGVQSRPGPLEGGQGGTALRPELPIAGGGTAAGRATLWRRRGSGSGHGNRGRHSWRRRWGWHRRSSRSRHHSPARGPAPAAIPLAPRVHLGRMPRPPSILLAALPLSPVPGRPPLLRPLPRPALIPLSRREQARVLGRGRQGQSGVERRRLLGSQQRPRQHHEQSDRARERCRPGGRAPVDPHACHAVPTPPRPRSPPGLAVMPAIVSRRFGIP